MRTLTAALLLTLFGMSATCFGQTGGQGPKLLLTPQRLRRLKRDCERQTVRWVNFEDRVRTVSDSPERGFELALYYAVTGDDARGREAIDWALKANDRRQAALVLDWCGPLLTDDARRKLVSRVSTPSATGLRDRLFSAIVSNRAIPDYTDAEKKAFINDLQRGGFTDPEKLYAACEFLMVYRTVERIDIREDAALFFSELPTEFLLSLKPDRAEHPEWMVHIAALALIAVDPNLQTSQFLQGWAMEDRQTIRDGPGVAYELLWADPYLPGVGYQNLDPWSYDSDTGRLFARTDWSPQACWIAVSPSRVEEEHCPANWQQETTKFGHLLLVPLRAECAELPARMGNDLGIIWKLPPNQAVVFIADKQQHTARADPAGMLRLGANITGKVCLPQEVKRGKTLLN